MITAEIKSQEAQWEEWLETLIETEANISSTLRELEEYQDGFREETEKIHESLREFEAQTRGINIPQSDAENITESIRTLVGDEATVKKLSSQARGLEVCTFEGV